MNSADLFFIFCDDQQFRRAKAIKNILIGRRTVSNLYWALEYNLLDYVDSLHGINFDDIDHTLHRLQQQKLLLLDDQMRVKLTTSGMMKRQQILSKLLPLKYLKIASQYDVSRFLQRFVFATQIVSEYSYSNRKYYPQSISFFEDQLIKKWFIQNKGQQLPELFHQLLTDFLNWVNRDDLATILVESLSGHHFSGKTEEQISNQQQVSPLVIQICWRQLYSCLLLEIFKKKVNEPLTALTTNLRRPIISNSSRQTYDLFIHHPEESTAIIASKRRIKITTVYEHLIEAAIFLPISQFPFQRLINPQIVDKLEFNQPALLGEWSYRDAVNKIPQLQFFEFRLYQILRRKQVNGKST
ncbi:MAG: hypothetical protein ABF679_02005 [Lentilactobacillus diolivorans]|uniref:hypothetical protein n=1 Tax=Lentilactobacillus diolivorans TaxID=179838 RepID=UPI0039E8CA49